MYIQYKYTVHTLILFFKIKNIYHYTYTFKEHVLLNDDDKIIKRYYLLINIYKK